MTVREMVRLAQVEIRDTPDLMPDRAAELLNQLSALIGNVNDEIRDADMLYSAVLLGCLESEGKANRARIKAEMSLEYRRRREARDVKELCIELIRSLKFFLRCKADELQMARHQ